ncbi:MAG: hypothetical protein DI527_09245 [Chelatococcus sp.]|nr:MAG: hypothetical protein DI527_09245 [Chelatococcus sp.]
MIHFPIIANATEAAGADRLRYEGTRFPMTSSPRSPARPDRQEIAGHGAEDGRQGEQHILPASFASEADQYETAAYIEALSAELRAMARGAGLEGLAYFLEMVRIEASIQVERSARATAR